ncbi:MAG: PKD domain-containing protein [Bacteroidota bacterium]
MKPFLFLSTILLLTACTKEPPIPMDEQPIFSFTGELGGQNIELVAGENDYFMETFFRRDNRNVREFVGRFRKIDCTDCREQLTIVFRDHVETVEEDPFDAQLSLPVQPYRFRGDPDDPDKKTFRFRAESNGTPPFAYDWDFGSGNRSTEAQPVFTFPDAGFQEVKVNITDANGCIDESRQQITSGNLFNNCEIGFNVNPRGGQAVEFSPLSPNMMAGFESIVWYFGDGTTLFNEPNPLHIYATEGIYEVKLLLFAANGRVCCAVRNIYSEPGASCVSHIQYRSASPDPELQTVYVEWIDAAGETYSSFSFLGQPDESFFQLNERNIFQENERTEETLKLAVELACTLYHTENEDKKQILRLGKSTMAVAHP